jgi:predicted O-methyltransferase YrrM
MDVDRFLQEIPAAVEDGSRFAAVLADVPGLAEPNNLALLNLAVRCLAPGEHYVEAGTFRGTSLISAALANDGASLVAIDNWSMGDGSREQLDENLARHGVSATILEGDVFDVLRAGIPSPVGVYYYDAGHSYEQQLAGMQLAEPYLASPSVVIVDDTDWERVERALDDYLAQQPRATEIFRADGKAAGHPEWYEGVRVLRWD